MAKKPKMNPISFFMVVVGIFIIISLNNIDEVEEGDERSVRPSPYSWDGQKDKYEIEIVDHSDKAEVGDTFTVDLKLENKLDIDGHMYVQCSILDRDEHTWIDTQSVVEFLKNDDNCVDDEPFTQTAEVYLTKFEIDTITFTVKVPNTVGGDNVIYCAAFEQCATHDYPTGRQSDYTTKEIEVIDPDSDKSNDDINIPDDTCKVDSDCRTWFWHTTECINGHCVDPEDDPTKLDVSDSKIKEWAKEHKILLWSIAGLALLVGMITIYREPKFGGF